MIHLYSLKTLLSRPFVNPGGMPADPLRAILRNCTPLLFPPQVQYNGLMSLPRLFAGIFFCSIAAISFEITLTRVFSISLWYHFAYMVISIAMLGLGLSGTVLSLMPALKNRKHLGRYAIGLSLAILAGYIGTNLVPLDPARLAWDRQQLVYIGLYYVLLALPFFLFGLIVTTAFSVESERSSLVYGADLLGAGAGSVTAVFLMSVLGPGTSIFAIALCALIGAAFLGRPRAALTLIVLILILAGINPNFVKIRMSQYKGLEQALRFPGARHLSTYYSGFSQVDIFESTMVRYAPGMSLKYLDPLPHQLGLAVDGAGINAITKAGENTSFLRSMPSALPYEIAERHRILVAEPKGGLPVLLAREYGADVIEQAESNHLIVDVIRKDYGDFSGGIYDTGTHRKLARSHLLSVDHAFDVIDISLTGAVPSGLFGMSEDYAFTVEAFKQYLLHLTDNGVVSLSMYLIPPPRTELRLLTTSLAALEEIGVSDAEEHIVAIRSWNSMTMLIKRSAFSPREIHALKEFARDRNFDLVYHPGIEEEATNVYVQLPEHDYYRAFKNLIDAGTRAGFIDDYIFDITPVYDESPFFHYHLRFDRLQETLQVMGGKWQFLVEEGYLLPVVFVQVLILSLILLFLPALKKRSDNRPAYFLIYFAFLGLGFMFVEVPLIQGMILPLENPSYAVAVVLASVLIWSGAGSLLSQKYSLLRRPETVLLIGALVVPYGFVLISVARHIALYAIELKFVLSFLLVAPAAFLMGIPFPMGIRLLGERSPGMIPWAWAVNGCFSVIAPVLATMLALEWGFHVVLLIGALLYAGAFAMIRGEWRS